jgi:tetratricopeptide (TPR) repeat protein
MLSAAEPSRVGGDPVESAKREFQQGKLEAARATLARASDGGQPSAQALDLLGCIYLEQQRFDEAIAAFKAAHESKPDFIMARIHLGDAFLRQNKWVEARAAYEAVIKDTNILMTNERLRFALLMTYLGAGDKAGAERAFERVTFPTETAAYYYAQAAWAFASAKKREGEKWIQTAAEIFDAKSIAWFARPLFDLGWIKTKPPLVTD